MRKVANNLYSVFKTTPSPCSKNSPLRVDTNGNSTAMYVRSRPSYPVMVMLTEGDRSVNELLMMLENLKKFLLVYPVVLKIRNAASLPSLYILILSCKKKGISVKKSFINSWVSFFVDDQAFFIDNFMSM